MKYSDFKKQVLNWPVIFSRDVVSSGKSGQAVRNQLERWKRAGRIIRLKKGVFILADDDRMVELSRPYMANQLYGPSYVSLEKVDFDDLKKDVERFLEDKNDLKLLEKGVIVKGVIDVFG